MSLLNGIAGFGASLATLAREAASDAMTPRPLLNSVTPDVRVAPDAPVAEAPSTLPTPAPVSDVARGPAGKGSVSVPPELLPIYEAASKRTGVPVDVLIAQGKQESSFNPNAVGSAGEIGLHQIKPSTAADPGFGMRGIDPATLKDPSVNINFAADYLKARGGPGLDFNNPASVDLALAKYNSGGDPNYVSNVRRYMGASS
jgi:soluble lytic murein transglycosylase-like protein